MPGIVPLNPLPCRLRRAALVIACGAVFAWAGLSAWSAMAAPVAGDFHQRTWTTDDGLPHNSVGNVLQDRAGYLWFATLGGLARFDGHEFHVFRPPPEFRALGYNIRGLAEESPGTLAVLPTGRNLLRLSGQTWSLHPANAALANTPGTPTEVYADPRGNLWIALTEARVLRWSPNGQTALIGADSGLVSRRRQLTLAFDSIGAWIGGDSLLRVRASGEVTNPFPEIRDTRAIATDEDGRLWVACDGRLRRIERDRIASEHELPPDSQLGSVRHLFADRGGSVWLSTTRLGLLRFHEGKVTRVSDTQATSWSAEDREGNLWVATDGGGVRRLQAKSYQFFNHTTGLPPETVSSLAEDSRGQVWLGLRVGGVLAVDREGRVQPHHLTGPRVFPNVVALDDRDRVWFGGSRFGLMRWDPAATERPVQLPEPAADLHLLFRSRNGDIWYAANGGRLGFYHGETVRTFGATEGYNGQDIRAMTQDRRGDFWLGGRDGELLRWDGTRFERFGAAQGFPHEPIHALWTDSEGLLWIGTANGLVLKDGERFRVLTEEHGLADNILQQIFEDDHGHLWFAARRGLFHARRTQLIAAARGSGERVDSHRLGPSQGLVGLTPTPNYQPAACKTADGRLWFATTQGVVAVSPARVPDDLPAPPVLIEELRIDGRAIPLGPPLKIPSGRHRLEFEVAALSYSAPESVVVRHQLEGIDTGWVDTGSDRIVSYTNLPPGGYRLRVIARNSAGRWNHEGATLAFTIVPAWWETRAARIGAVVLLTVLTAWAARRIAQRRLRERLRRLEQEHALEKERQRIARDLHDDLGASLTELGLMTDRLATRGASDVGPQLATVAWHTRRLATELSSIVWTMNPRSASLDRLGEFIRQYAQRLFHGLPIACSVKGDRLPALPLVPDWQHQIIATMREALNNVLKHSRASRVQIDLQYTAGEFSITIADDGLGFSPEAADHADGNGLRNIRSRAADIGASVTIESVPGRGTRIRVTGPLQTLTENGETSGR